MAKVFNVSAVCIPEDHYMVNIDKRLAEIKKLVDDGKYFTINCARQYGKTTTLRALKEYLRNDYYAVLSDFQNILFKVKLICFQSAPGCTVAGSWHISDTLSRQRRMTMCNCAGGGAFGMLAEICPHPKGLPLLLPDGKININILCMTQCTTRRAK